jgi:hypothetical protein
MRSILIMVLFGVFICFTCSQVQAGSKNENLAVGSAKAWLSLIDGGQYSESWTEASTYFKGAITQTKWEAALMGVRKPLGRLISRKVVSTKETSELPGAPDGKYVVIICKSSFENKKKATETITFMFETNRSWKAAGYYIK